MSIEKAINIFYDRLNVNTVGLKDRIDSIYVLFSHLKQKGFQKKDISEDDMRLIIDKALCSNDYVYPEILKLYLSHYIIMANRLIMGSKKVTINKKKIEAEIDYETVDVRPDDIPDKQYDLEFLKLIGVENPE